MALDDTRNMLADWEVVEDNVTSDVHTLFRDAYPLEERERAMRTLRRVIAGITLYYDGGC
jgi:hypothetical protein